MYPAATSALTATKPTQGAIVWFVDRPLFAKPNATAVESAANANSNLTITTALSVILRRLFQGQRKPVPIA